MLPGYQTIRLTIEAGQQDRAAIQMAAQAIRRGELVAFPTETVYGLGADALNGEAVERIFAAKERPPDNPLIVHVASTADISPLTREIPVLAHRLADRFWPGPLTLVLLRSQRVPDVTTGGLDTVAVRVPAHAVARDLIREAERPLAAPSANRSGRPSPTSAEHVLEDLEGRVAVVLDAGPCAVGVESTVLDVTTSPPTLLRPGGVPREAIEEVTGPVAGISEDPAVQKRSPGTRYRHYAPRASVVVADSGEAAALAHRLAGEGHGRVGLLTRSPHSGASGELRVRIVAGSVEDYAHALFAALRDLDRDDCSIVVVEGVEETGLGLAIMDRLRRAAAAGLRNHTTDDMT